MRIILSFTLLFAFACQSDIERYDGEGCQPACRTLDTEDTSQTTAICLTEDLEPDTCAALGVITPACAGGVLTCDTATGLPVCEGATEANLIPTCSP